MKKALGVLIALFLLLFATVPLSSAYRTTTFSMSSDHLKLYSDSGGSWLIGYSENSCHIEKLCPDTRGADLQLSRAIAEVGVFDNVVVALCNDAANNKLDVYTYCVDTDILDCFAIDSYHYHGSRGFYYDSNSIYLVSDPQPDCIERYSTSGVLMNRYAFDDVILQLGSDYCGRLFAVCANTLFHLNGSRFDAVSGSAVTVPVRYFAGDLLSDPSGRIIRDNGTSCSLLFNADSDFEDRSACCIDGIVYYPSRNRITGYALSSGAKEYELLTEHTSLGLYADNGYVCSLSDNGSPTVDRIRTDEFTSVRQDEPQQNDDHPQPVEQDHPFGGGTISSAVYWIDFDAYRISGIPAGTTLAQFKRSVNHDGFGVRFFRGGAEKKSGNCGTAMTAVFDGGSVSYTFELSVIGDITGEGSVNSRDLSLLMEYLLGTADFNGVYLLSADLSGNGVIDVKDLAMLHRMY